MKAKLTHIKQLENLRKELNSIDFELVLLMEKRLNIAQKIGNVKEKLKLPLTDLNREQEIIKRLTLLTNNIVLKNSITNIFSELFLLSKTVRILEIEKLIPFKKIGIIGLGIIGGSIARVIKSKNPKITISTLKRNSDDIKWALEEKIIDCEFQNMTKFVNNNDLIILASPINTIIPLSNQILKNSLNLSKKLIVIDCASVKEQISLEFSRLSNKNVEFVATHPMSGSEKQGFKNSKLTMFINRPWIITSHNKNSLETVNIVKKLVMFFGSNPIEINAESHDRKVALISHLAFILSEAFNSFVKKSDTNSLKIAGPGFKSMTRLAQGNKEMHKQIIQNNKSNISSTLNKFINFLKKYENINN